MSAKMIAEGHKNKLRRIIIKGARLTNEELRRMVSKRLTWLYTDRKIDSQAEFAEKVGVYQTHISNMLAGRKMPSAEVLNRLADALETNTDFILGRTTDHKPASDLDDQIVLSAEDATRRRLLQAICDCLEDAPDGDLKIFLEIARRFGGSKAIAARNREDLWAELWAIIAMIGGDDLTRAFRRAMGEGGTLSGRRSNAGVDEFAKQMN